MFTKFKIKYQELLYRLQNAFEGFDMINLMHASYGEKLPLVFNMEVYLGKDIK